MSRTKQSIKEETLASTQPRAILCKKITKKTAPATGGAKYPPKLSKWICSTGSLSHNSIQYRLREWKKNFPGLYLIFRRCYRIPAADDSQDPRVVSLKDKKHYAGYWCLPNILKHFLKLKKVPAKL